VLLIPPGSGKEPGRVPVGFPGEAQQSQRIFGQGDVAVFGALATVDMDLHALAIDVGDLQGEGVVEPQSSARDRGEVDLIVEGGGRREETPDFCNTEDGGKAVCAVRTHERQGRPVAMENVLGEEADTTGADAHGAGASLSTFFRWRK
jgi:hypothetical protein